jgi:hypothetical protein
MARVNISLPDELYRRAKEEGINISKLAQQALTDELDRLDKIAAVDRYLAELEAEEGPIDPKELAEAEAWADRVFGPAERSSSA